MKYISESVASAVLDMLEKQKTSEQGRVLITLPSYGASFLLAIAERLQELAAQNDVYFQCKFAKNAVKKWQDTEQQQAHDNDWVDTEGNLTVYRNARIEPGKSLVVLGAVNDIVDTASLSDFTLCDEKYLWECQMGRSFDSWFTLLVKKMQFYITGEKECAPLDSILRPLQSLSSGGLLAISEWLETLNLDQCGSVNDVAKYMLRHLDAFALPNCCGFNVKGKKNFTTYTQFATSFFAYEIFMTESGRKKSCTAIDAFRDLYRQEDRKALRLEDDRELLFPSYPTLLDFADGLERYIRDYDQEDAEKLKKCDIVTIRDVILKSKLPSKKKVREGMYKLFEPLVESVLTAVWQGLGAWRKELKKSHAVVTSIELATVSYSFANDELTDDDNGMLSADEARYLGEMQIKELITGIDSILDKHLNILQNSHADQIRFYSSLENIPVCVSSRKSPTLLFTVTVTSNDDGQEESVTSKFEWVVPEKHEDRLNRTLLQRAYQNAEDARKTFLSEPELPVYHMDYYDEILTTSDECDTRGIICNSLRHGAKKTGEFVFNLYKDFGQSCDSNLRDCLLKLDAAYFSFLGNATKKSLLSALFIDDGKGASPAQRFRQCFQHAFRDSTSKAAEGKCDFAAVLMRAFLVIQQQEHQLGVSKSIATFEPSALVTVLHPALLEQLEARISFLFSAFIFACKSGFSSREQTFAASLWQHYVSLAAIQMPLFGLIADSGNTLSTHVRGHGCFHKIGMPLKQTPSTLSTRVYSSEESKENGLSEVQLLKKSAESMLLENFLQEYFKVRPHTWDGISIAVYRNQNIQPVIAGIHAFLEWLHTEAKEDEEDYNALRPERRAPYDVRIVFLTDSNDISDLRAWIAYWQDCWEKALNDGSNKRTACYRYCRLSIAHRFASEADGMKSVINKEQFNADVALVYGVTEFETSTSECRAVPQFDVRGATLKFPVLEKKYCPSTHDLESMSRTRIISQRQFAVASDHAKLMHVLTKRENPDASMIVRNSRFTNCISIMDSLHAKSEWVICIDPAVDEKLIAVSGANQKRDIIAFGSGVGTHGEANYTISSEHFSFDDIRDNLAQVVQNLYGKFALPKEKYAEMVDALLRVENLSGMGLIKATSIRNFHIHDFFASALSRKLLHTKKDIYLCDIIVSLDAYKHWFQFTENKKRPDLLWLTAEERNGQLHVRATLVECKLQQQNGAAVRHAQTQLANGLSILRPCFAPKGKEVLDDDRPDRRYWWTQLHRIITSRLQAQDSATAQDYVVLLEKLAEGLFTIEWDALLLAYWHTLDGDAVRCVEQWNIDGAVASHFEIGRQRQYTLALAKEEDLDVWERPEREVLGDRWQDDAVENNGQESSRFEPKRGISDDEDLKHQSHAEDQDENEEYDEDEDYDEREAWEKSSLPFEVEGPIKKDTTQKEQLGVRTDSEQQISKGLEALLQDFEPRSDVVAQKLNTKELGGHCEPKAQIEGRLATHIVVEEPIQPNQVKQMSQASSQNNAPQVSSIIEENTIPEKNTMPEDTIAEEQKNSDIPEHVFLGYDRNRNPIYWDFKDATNRHLLIFGSSGNGKTYAIQCILAELARAGLSPLILDYSQSFVPDEIQAPVQRYFPESGQRFVAHDPLPINPFQAQANYLGSRVFKDKPHDIAGRVVAIFEKVCNLGSQQIHTLTDAIIEGVESEGDNFSFDSLVMLLESYIDDGKHPKNSVMTLLSHIQAFARQKPFETKGGKEIGWEALYADPEVKNNIFQLAHIAPHIAAAIIEFTLWDLFAHVQRHKSTDSPKVVVLDEIQNLSLKEGSPVEKYLREGRKFGLALIAATQSFAGVKYALSTLNQAAHKLYFRPADNELADFGKLFNDLDSSRSAAEWKKALARLERGQCFFVGSSTTQNHIGIRLVNIASMEDRHFES